MAHQFATDPERYTVLNMSYGTIVGHSAYGGGTPAVPYLPRSLHCKSILCVPMKREITNDFIGMIKVDNKCDSIPSGEMFSHEEVEALKKYSTLATKILSHPGLDLSDARPA
jgi:hypothetical protein